jgi:hypothetical protein
MDELIWKYLDDQCTDDETATVKKLLAEDTGFQQKYDELRTLNIQLTAATCIEMRVEFKASLEKEVLLGVKASRVGITDIISLQSMIALVVSGVAAAIFALRLPDSGTLGDFSLHVDEKVISIIAWTTIGFILLFIFDSIFEKMSVLRKTAGLFF